MMMHFHDPAKLQTKMIVFEDVYYAHDSGTLEQLKELSSKRRLMEISINESSFITEAIAREMSGGLTSHYEQDLQKLEQYLPLLENLIFHVDLVGDDRKMVRWTSDLKIRWTSSLSSSSFFSLTGSKFFQIDNLRFERGMTLFLYGATLRERALEILPEDLVQSAILFRKAAGVYYYLAHEVLPPLQPVLPAERPPESNPSVSSVMSLICLADAQAVTIRKAEEKGNTCALLAKLHYGVTQFLDEATGALYSATAGYKDISSRLVDFISYCKELHWLRSQRFLAESLKSSDQVGAGVGVLREALIYVKKKTPGEEAWRLVFLVLKKEIEIVQDLLGKYEHENDFVWREKILANDELPLPEGKKIVSFIPYQPQRWERELVFKI